ncbi:MAG TPA: DUF86 domain-containing protein [Myxococcales bacterium]|nr:DUF86 domain-containing protein [Myxococcales bacterium]
MLGALQRIETYISGMSAEQLANDSKTLAAVNYELLVLGEAAVQMPAEVVSAHPEIPWKQIRGTRNVLVHGYFQLSLPTLWETVQRDLPALRPQLEALLTTIS